MEYRRLGRSDIRVSALSLGTMTFGEQTPEAEAHRQLDYALDRGVNLIDTAEMYAIPPRAETYGRTEAIIGNWIKSRRNRDRFVLATKVLGPGAAFTYVRGGQPRLDRRNIEAAIDASLKRLNTDYVDLYQLHWPDRKANFFGPLDYVHGDEPFTPLLETLSVLDDLVKAGKVRQIGVSNETPWGLATYLHLAETHGLARMASIQNPYGPLNRSFEIGLAEIAIREECGLLAYSVLGMGVLSGKYLDGAQPHGARLTLYPHYTRYRGARAEEAAAAYVALAREFGVDPSQMALAFARDRRFMTSVIVGATTLAQLEVNLGAAELVLAPDLLARIDAIHRINPNPCP